MVTFNVAPQIIGTELEITQTGFTNEESMEHSESNWKSVLEQMKKIVESEI